MLNRNYLYFAMLLLFFLGSSILAGSCTNEHSQEKVSTEKQTEPTKEQKKTDETTKPDASRPDASTPETSEPVVEEEHKQVEVSVEKEQPNPQKEQEPKESSMATCSFNVDCPKQERCECDENTGCFCKLGKRGTGKNGVTECKTGNDCESSVCSEGHGGKFYCSGQCNSNADCEKHLPLCSNIAFVGKICIRKP